ncbi:MAG: aminotransferase class IV [Sedimentisphaerales bacterium]|nr:aminotransferase class IV [Sedimentisphaerales bacterium]
MNLAMIGDRIVEGNQLGPEYLDRGLYFGDGVYEVLRSYQGRIFALEDHLARFARSMHEVGIHEPDIGQIRQRILRIFGQAGLPNAKIYFHLTRGSEPRNHTPRKGLLPNFFMTIGPAPDSTKDKAQGVAVSTFPDWRWKRCDIKSLNLLPNVLARMDAEKKGCAEAILVNEAGEITEGSGSAFFAIDAKRNELITRPLGHEILPSITRQHVIRAAQGSDLKVVERTLTPADAAGLDELFLAVTTKDIVPVIRFDGQHIRDGKPGFLTKFLIDRFAALVCQDEKTKTPAS